MTENHDKSRPQRKIFPKIIQILEIGDKVFKRSMITILKKINQNMEKAIEKRIFSHREFNCVI